MNDDERPGPSPSDAATPKPAADATPPIAEVRPAEVRPVEATPVSPPWIVTAGGVTTPSVSSSEAASATPLPDPTSSARTPPTVERTSHATGTRTSGASGSASGAAAAPVPPSVGAGNGGPLPPRPSSYPVAGDRGRGTRLPLALALLALIGVICLAVAVARLYQRPVPTAPAAADVTPQLARLEAAETDLTAKLAATQTLAQHAQDQVAALLARPSSSGAAPSVQPLEDEIAALRQRLDKLASAPTAQQSPPATASPSPGIDPAALATLGDRLNALAQRQAEEQAASRQSIAGARQTIADLQAQLTALNGRTGTLAASTALLPKLSARADHVTQLMAAQEKLRLGQPLGALEGAPPALARFATNPPPTEAQLKLSFPAAAAAANRAGRAVPDKTGFWNRLWLRASDLVVVRRGDRVLVGDPAAGLVSHAGTLVNAGDFAGAVTLLKTLPDAPRAAMAPWIDQAEALIAARAALAQMAAG